MAILSNFLQTIKNSPIGQGLDVLSAAFISPVSTAEALFSKDKTISQVVSNVEQKPLSEKITSTLLTTAAAGTILYGGAAVASGKGATILSSLIPKTATGKIIAALTLPVAAGTIIGNPQIVEELPKVPAQSFEIAKGIASGKNIIQSIKENPVGAAVLGAGAVIIAKGVTSSVATILNTEAVKKNTQASSNNQLPITTKSGDISNQPIATDNLLPQVPATKRVPNTKSSSGKKKIKRILPSVNQRVQVIVQQRNNNQHYSKRYLNREVLIH